MQTTTMTQGLLNLDSSVGNSVHPYCLASAWKSGRPDQNLSRVFFILLKVPFTSNPICGIPAGRSSQFASRLVSENSPHDEFTKTRGGRSAIQKLLNGRKLIARDLASMGEIRGTLCISRLLNLRNCKLVITHSGRPELRNVSQFLVLIVLF